MSSVARDARVPVTNNPDPVVHGRGVFKRFGGYTAVDHIDFDVYGARCFGFLGPNGAGKTTTLRLAMGLAPLDGGELTVFGQPVSTRASRIRARVGIVPQADNLDPDFTVEENLRVYASFFGLRRKYIENRIPELLEFAALTERRDARTDTLSGGMRRRLTIARALINDPDLVVLDEPTTGLDPQARHVIWGRLSELKAAGKTLLLTTHYMEEAERLCDELVIMDRGRILDQGAPRELIGRHVEPEVIEVRGAQGAVLRGIGESAGCRLEQMGSSLYCYTHASGPLIARLRDIPDLTYIHRPTGLEDVFLRLTGRELRD
jgi:lipooligosaccharide transport system ATP-binding protein